MASENKSCMECVSFRLALVEKENDIKKLKIHILNLTNYLLWKDNSAGTIQDMKAYDINNVSKVEVNEQKFYFSELFIRSCDVLDECTVLESKSTQTESSGNCDDFKDLLGDNIKTSASEDGHFQDYVYDKNYQMYYSLTTGYYYDDKSGLMYEPQSCTYYRYNYENNEYEKVSHGETSNVEEENHVSEDTNENSYSCEAVVDQVNNLNLNDDSTKVEKSYVQNENNNTLETGILTNEPENGNCNVVNLEKSEEDVSLGCAPEWQPTEGSKLTVTDIVKQVVDEHNNMSDYVFDETYRMYYSASTGYYFDAVRNLLYDPTSGIYYFYDADKQTYEFYCQTEPNITNNSNTELINDSVDKERLASRKLYWKKKLGHSKQNSETINCDANNDDDKVSEDLEEFSSPEDGEIFSSDDEDSNIPVCIVKSPVKGLKQKSSKEVYPPSIRAIVEDSEKLQIGSLILITCNGGMVGRDKWNEVYIPDICVSKLHAEIKYSSNCQSYSIEDLGSQNGTFVNEKRLSEPKAKSEPCTLNHGDKLSLGSCKLLLHIHDGHDTCDKCEPGQVLAEISSNIDKNAVVLTKEEKETARRKELKRLKQKYGLQRADFERKKSSLTSKKYEDKSEIRRQTVGSDNPYEKTQEASFDVSMPETNKGYQMLKKMGWKEGQTLGTTESGLVEPIPLRPWTSKAGLGSPWDLSSSTSQSQQNRRAQKWVKAQERFFQLSLGSDAAQEGSTIPHDHHQDSLPPI